MTFGIKPDNVAHNLKHLLELCENIPFSEIPVYIEQQKTRKQKLEQELQELERMEVDAKNRVDKALTEEGITRHDSNFRRELWKQETSVDEISQFSVKGISEGSKTHFANSIFLEKDVRLVLTYLGYIFTVIFES
jgi:hypothetical protein